jgi:hypothetical protein
VEAFTVTVANVIKLFTAVSYDFFLIC